MWRRKEQKYNLSLMLIVISFLNSCAPEICEQSVLPQFPHAGAKVANELQTLSSEEFPNLWEWIGRINKLRMELED